ncbi:pcyt-2.1 [Pristionchus pacificus]|uniref:ethanolamine-phosphate cytidylyltransferase n=1 Tax=Pristionchus pacificus TaxID=54126 RepID=A0A2A6CT69_PRIPA|nr:pcyt-2.1 [Pristionchus pacificus]|eukprot:PDM81233.1 hypothetical protein PRIPAC_36236 [Pristionchus pacificus]
MSSCEQSSVDKPERVWCDGCYDMVHFGHANQLRQAKKFGKKLIVGVHNDEEVTLHKGPPVFTEEERYRMVRGIKWVDEVIEDAPYSTTIATLDKYDCAFCIHGDDITMTADGRDTYEEVKNEGRYKECKRTAGVSTTDLLGRMLMLSRIHHSREDAIDQEIEKTRSLSTSKCAESPWTRVSRFITSTRTLMEFSAGNKPQAGDKIVYVSGAFDLFHIGHLCFLEAARALGDYLIVGILNDQTVNSYRGGCHPIMNLNERVLSVLAYKPVSEVIIGAPYHITGELIDQFNIAVVVQGSRVSHHQSPEDTEDPYTAAKERGIFTTIDSGSDVTTDAVIQRIFDRRLVYEARNAKKVKKELAAVEALQKMQNGNGKLDTRNAVVIDTSNL